MSAGNTCSSIFFLRAFPQNCKSSLQNKSLDHPQSMIIRLRQSKIMNRYTILDFVSLMVYFV